MFVYEVLNRLRLYILIGGAACIVLSICKSEAYVYDVDFNDWSGEQQRSIEEHQGREAREACQEAEADGREPSERDRERAREYEAEHTV
jgi:hypothetical protein